MSRLIFVFFIFGFSACISQKKQRVMIEAAINDPQAAYLARPTKAQYDYQERERILFLHLSPAAWQGEEWDKEITPLEAINPRSLSTDQWVDAARSFDAKTILYVAKHVGGFCWWQTESSAYSIKNTPYKQGKGDVLDELIASARKSGLQMGIYIYPGDQAHWGNRIGTGGITSDPAKQEAYNKVFRLQYAEVLSRFQAYPGLLNELWFDGSCRIDLQDLIRQYAPEALVLQGPMANLRWCGNEGGFLPYPSWNSLSIDDLKSGVATVNQSNPDGNAWAPLEVDIPNMGHRWIWSPANESDMRSVANLVKLYYQSVGRGGVFLLNASPDTSGLIPQSHMNVYKEFGAELKSRFSNPLGKKSGLGNSYRIKFNKPRTINQFMIREDYRYGERIRAFEVKVRNSRGEWKLVNRGSAVGSKRIVVFDDTEATEVSLEITKSVGKPLLREFSVYKLDGNNDFLKFPDDNIEFKEELKWVACPILFQSRQAIIDISDKISIPSQYRFKIESHSAYPVKRVRVAYDGVFILNEMVRNEGDGIYNFTHTAATTKDHKITVHIDFDTDARNVGLKFSMEEKKPQF